MVWDTTPEAWREWRKARSAEYQDPANASVKEPLAVNLWEVFSESLEEGMLQTGAPESEAPSMTLHVDVKTQENAAGKGPYPEFVEAFAQLSPKRAEQPVGLGDKITQRVAMMLLGPHCFLRIYGVNGLERWIVRKFSVSHAWKARAERRRAKSATTR